MTRKLYKIVADVFGEDISKISDSTTQNDIENWDSLQLLILIDEIEKEYNVKILIDEIIDINSILDIKNILEKYGTWN